MKVYSRPVKPTLPQRTPLLLWLVLRCPSSGRVLAVSATQRAPPHRKGATRVLLPESCCLTYLIWPHCLAQCKKRAVHSWLISCDFWHAKVPGSGEDIFKEAKCFWKRILLAEAHIRPCQVEADAGDIDSMGSPWRGMVPGQPLRLSESCHLLLP